MNNKKFIKCITCNGLFIFLVLLCQVFSPAAVKKRQPASYAEIEDKVRGFMAEGKIPGLSLAIVRSDGSVYTKGFGYADVEKKTPVTPATLFELCSTSKAFTALAVLKCEEDGLIDLDSPAAKYLPWFYAMYKGEKQEITIRQLLHQTSGIPFRSISRIPESEAEDALQQTVRGVAGIELDDLPGASYRYATVNYDILGAVLEAATGMKYEDYMLKNIIRPLGLQHTLVGSLQAQAAPPGNRAAGYKISFFKARKYDAPIYRGNTPAGYIFSNASDLARWLKLQSGMEESPFTPLIEESHKQDTTVPLDTNTLLSYAMGWMVALNGSGAILHTGLNPNFSAFIMFNPQDKTGVAVLANSNSNYTPYIGRSVMNLLYGQPLPPQVDLGDSVDRATSVLSIILVLFFLFVFAFYGLIAVEIVKGRRSFAPITPKAILRFIAVPVMMLPFAAGVYLLPRVIADVNWKTAIVWSPVSFKIAAIFILIALVLSYFGYLFSALFPHRNKYLRSVPFLVIISILSGGSNAVVIFLISMSLYTTIKLGYMVFYFGLAALLYLIGRKVLQVRLVEISFSIINDLRMKLIRLIFRTSYQRYEKLDSGRVIAVLNNDTNQLGGTANLFVTILSSIITIIGAFLYLAAIAFWATLVTMTVIVIVATIYYFISRKAQVLFNRARDTQDGYIAMLNGMNDGFKELSLHSAKKTAYENDIEDICSQFLQNATTAMTKFVNGFMIGESMLIAVLAAVAFVIPLVLPHLKISTLMSFIMVILYLIGPVTAILNAIPGMLQMKVSWERVQGLMKDIPANIPGSIQPALTERVSGVQEIKAENVYFEYESEDENEKFTVGPTNFEAKKGEVIFIIGGNGSGKTTLAKLLTGLYIPSRGSIAVDGKEITNDRLGEYFSVVFGDYHLFEKLYDVDLTDKEKDVEEYLKMLRLDEKVSIENNAFSTLDLSGGQRKRLALLRCYLEDRPIYLFDEVAADQDPEFRKFFYRNLLAKMKERGKIVIAITHDDHYFDAADRVIKMDMGRIEQVEDTLQLRLTK